ncbi:MAG TPA: TIGR04283 family arsenosugar biosynthesis glycosyltransferase [Vicinamibacterales bacterium]|jgi:rSAM/selenodomain-associated transferase 2|nr:TIGR04283 family arsenosugar biosynthesis glycosyltransferase [Vicinamibacterales bacterium]
MLISIIIPVYQDADALARALDVTDFSGAEVIVATAIGDSSLNALRAARPDLIWVSAPQGRARQMNAGAAIARGEWLVFLHADTHLPAAWRDAIDRARADTRVGLGCFRFALDSPAAAARVIELGVRLRVRLFGLPYGDQALFVRREVFAELGGYSDVPIMEDVDLVRRLRARGRLFRASERAVTSARRWEEDGWVKRTARHLRLILRYFAGIHPERLV